MTSSENGAPHKESLMVEINNLFAPPTAESYGKKGLAGIPSLRRAKKLGGDTSTSDLATIPDFVPSVVSTYNSSQANRDDPFWRKPRPNCHEYCDSCGCTEGDRLVCDRCPASFHLECLDPPMDSDEAPTGVWFCHRCSRLLEDEEDQDSTCSSQGTTLTESGSTRSSRTKRMGGRKRDLIQLIAVNPIPSSSQASQQAQPSKRNTCISRAVTNERALAGRSSRSAAWGESAYVADTEESELRALWNVIKYSQYQNPKEFDLPKDLMPSIKLPGSYKTVAERKGKSIIDLENGLIPRPVRRCFVCSRTCMLAPLLPCDYCSACFHLECLDPPLPHFPPRSDRWMCPNHVEHVADRYLVRSIRLTERMRIWSELAKVHCPATKKEDISCCTASEVNAINAEVECETAETSEKTSQLKTITSPEAPSLDVIAPYELTYGPDDEASILADLMRRVQRGRAEKSLLIDSLTSTTETSPDDLSMANPFFSSSDSRHLWHVNQMVRSHSLTVHTSRDQVRIVVPTAVKTMYARGVRQLPCPSEFKQLQSNRIGSKQDEELLFVRGLLQFYLKNSSDTKQRGENDVLKKITADDIMAHSDKSTYPVELSTNSVPADFLKQLEALNTCFNELPSEKQPPVDIHLILSLAKQRVEELSGQANEAKSLPISKHPNLSDKLRARAVFIPCGNTSGPTARMSYRKFTIGTSPDCHLRLTNYKLADMPTGCPYVSTHHATVFYDEWSHHFELLNYGELGSLVDGILYGNELQPRWRFGLKLSSTQEKIRNLMQRDRANGYLDYVPPSAKRIKMMAPRVENLSGHCCPGFIPQVDQETDEETEPVADSDNMVWEGSAILRHGSVLQFGCYQFVMGLVDTGTLN